MNTDAATLRSFITSGHATFTVKSLGTGKHFTFRVTRAKHSGTFYSTATEGRPAPWFVSVLTGSDNTWDYTYAGLMIEHASGELGFRLTAKSGVGETSLSANGFRWLLGHINRGNDIGHMAEVDPMGKCGRCGRALTHPESIRTGLGPECATKV